MKEFVRAIHVGFPDIRIHVEDMIAEGDMVVARWRTTSQTHSGGKLHETWLELDALGMAEQMGLVPTESMSTFRKMLLMLSTPLRLAFLEARYQIRSGRAGTKAS